MTKMERARCIRDLVLAEAGLTVGASLALNGGRFVTREKWRAVIRRERLVIGAMGEVQAAKMTIWVDEQKFAVMAWTKDLFRLVKYARGQWETIHFNLPPYRNSAERWVDVCSTPPSDRSVLALMQAATPRRAAEAVTAS